MPLPQTSETRSPIAVTEDSEQVGYAESWQRCERDYKRAYKEVAAAARYLRLPV